MKCQGFLQSQTSRIFYSHYLPLICLILCLIFSYSPEWLVRRRYVCACWSVSLADLQRYRRFDLTALHRLAPYCHALGYVHQRCSSLTKHMAGLPLCPHSGMLTKHPALRDPLSPPPCHLHLTPVTPKCWQLISPVSSKLTQQRVNRWTLSRVNPVYLHC